MNGKVIESLVIAKLEQKCDIKRESIYDHSYKLDLVIHKFKNIDRIIPIGVQVTTRLGDAAKMKAFLKERKKKILVDKSVYIEIHPDIDVDGISAWGSELMYTALASFAFQKEAGHGDITGIRINPGISYEFFDIEEAANAVEEMPVGATLSGKIVEYKKNSGYGRIETPEGSWFLHISQISDDRLKDNFIANIQVDPDGRVIKPIYVDFNNGGFKKQDAKHPVATDVKLSVRK